MPEIKKGTTSVTRYVMIVDSGDGSPELDVDVTTLDLQYTRTGAAPAAKVDAASLGAIDAAWDDNEMFQVDKLASPGLYRVDWPNAAFASGVEGVILVVSGTGFAPAVEDITLVDNVVGDALDASDRVDVGAWLGTAVTLSAGAPDVNVQSTDDIDLSATQKTSVNTEADNAIESYNLDHLLSVAVLDADVVDNSVFAQLVSDSATAGWDDFDSTRDSLMAIRNKETDIETDTAVIGALGAGLTAVPWNSAWDAEVQSEVDDALVALSLDHLVAVADADDVVDDSIIAKLASKAATANWSDFVHTTDSLQAIRDEINFYRIFSGTSTASSTTTKVFVQAGDPPAGGADDDYNDTIIVVWDGADKTTARLNVRVVDDYDDSDPSFTVSPALGFTPGAGDLVEIYLADSGALTLLNTLSSGFSAASPNRLIDHLRSIMSKGAVTPATLGTYDPATDSLEYQGERLALIAGAGFDTSTDSLKQIRDAIDTLVAPAVISSSALSGSGFLSDVVSLIRQATDEPSASAKYTDSNLVELIQVGMDTVLTDIHINTDHPITVRYNVTLVDGTQDYVLPPNVGELLQIAKINSTTGLPEYEVWPGSYMNPGGQGWKLEGNTLRLLRDWDSTDTLQLLYIPNSEPLMHYGTPEAVTASTITLMAIPTDGTLGKRPNEYVGMLVRMLTSTTFVQEERLITAYDVTTRIATINKAWDTTPVGTMTYEVVPVYSRMIKHLVALRASIDLLSQEGNSQRMATLNQNYLIKMSALRRQISKKEGRFPHHFDGDTWDNENRGGFYGM